MEDQSDDEWPVRVTVQCINVHMRLDLDDMDELSKAHYGLDIREDSQHIRDRRTNKHNPTTTTSVLLTLITFIFSCLGVAVQTAQI